MSFVEPSRARVLPTEQIANVALSEAERLQNEVLEGQRLEGQEFVEIFLQQGEEPIAKSYVFPCALITISKASSSISKGPAFAVFTTKRVLIVDSSVVKATMVKPIDPASLGNPSREKGAMKLLGILRGARPQPADGEKSEGDLKGSTEPVSWALVADTHEFLSRPLCNITDVSLSFLSASGAWERRNPPNANPEECKCHPPYCLIVLILILIFVVVLPLACNITDSFRDNSGYNHDMNSGVKGWLIALVIICSLLLLLFLWWENRFYGSYCNREGRESRVGAADAPAESSSSSAPLLSTSTQVAGEPPVVDPSSASVRFGRMRGSRREIVINDRVLGKLSLILAESVLVKDIALAVAAMQPLLSHVPARVTTECQTDLLAFYHSDALERGGWESIKGKHIKQKEEKRSREEVLNRV